MRLDIVMDSSRTRWTMRGASAVTIVLLTSCLIPRQKPVQVYQRQVVFDAAEYAPYAGKGDCSLSGQAFMMTRGGEAKKAAGKRVALLPVTGYSSEWFEHAIQAGQPLSARDKREAKYERTTTADADGRFTFTGLPAGSYYVATRVDWEVPDTVYTGFGYTTIMRNQGGPLGARVECKAGQHVEIILHE